VLRESTLAKKNRSRPGSQRLPVAEAIELYVPKYLVVEETLRIRLIEVIVVAAARSELAQGDRDRVTKPAIGRPDLRSKPTYLWSIEVLGDSPTELVYIMSCERTDTYLRTDREKLRVHIGNGLYQLTR
jgi:hypothetical protein